MKKIILIYSILGFFFLSDCQSKISLVDLSNDICNYEINRAVLSQQEISNILDSIACLKLNSNYDTLKYVEYLDKMTHNYLVLGNYILSAYYYEKLLDLYPNDSYYIADYAFELYAQGKFENAIREYSKALSIDSKDGITYRMFGNLYFSIGRNDIAKDLYLSAFDNSQTDRNINYILLMMRLNNMLLGNDTKISSSDTTWPYPILCFINNEIDEDQLVKIIKKEDDIGSI